MTLTLKQRRKSLCDTYEITTTTRGKYTAITPAGANALIYNFFTQITDALASFDKKKSKWGLSDDDYDYTNAAIGQLQLWHSLEFWGMDHDAEDTVTDRILAILNCDDETVASTHTDAFDDCYCLKYGFADHYTHLSELAHMNDD